MTVSRKAGINPLIAAWKIVRASPMKKKKKNRFCVCKRGKKSVWKSSGFIMLASLQPMRSMFWWAQRLVPEGDRKEEKRLHWAESMEKGRRREVVWEWTRSRVALGQEKAEHACTGTSVLGRTSDTGPEGWEESWKKEIWSLSPTSETRWDKSKRIYRGPCIQQDSVHLTVCLTARQTFTKRALKGNN